VNIHRSQLGYLSSLGLLACTLMSAMNSGLVSFIIIIPCFELDVLYMGQTAKTAILNAPNAIPRGGQLTML
jgi:hypothetical protein